MKLRCILPLAALSLAACDNETRAPQKMHATREASSQVLKITANAVALGDKFVIDGSTNLPEGALLIVSIAKRNGRLTGQSDAKVINHSYGSDQFSDRGRPYSTGTYRVTITGPIADLQPQDVRDLVGKDYANYTGKLMTIHDGDRTPELTAEMKLPPRNR